MFLFNHYELTSFDIDTDNNTVNINIDLSTDDNDVTASITDGLLFFNSAISYIDPNEYNLVKSHRQDFIVLCLYSVRRKISCPKF